jgi:hypothetical protein
VSDQVTELEAQESAVKEIAAVLRSTEAMAAQFAERVQERVGEQVSYDEILAAMQDISAKRLTMGKVVIKVRRQLD